MSAQSATLAGRQAALRIMQDTCTVTRETGRTFNEDTGLYAVTHETVYEGVCRVRSNDLGTEASAEERAVPLHSYIVSLPITAHPLVGDIVTVTASSLDPDLVGVAMVVRDVIKATNVTARRLRCEEQA